MTKKLTIKSLNKVAPEFCSWLAGLVDGEGSLQIKHQKKRWWLELTISLRDDEQQMLDMIRTELGRGSCYLHNSKNPQLRSKPRYMLRFHNAADTRFFTALFERYPLRSKKRHVFELWAKARKELDKPSWSRDQAYLRYLYSAIRQVRNYGYLAIEPYKSKGEQTTLPL
jgi:hypothetical protein